MACPMNCAKQMRNGPCGGVRADGGCEVKTAMRCVWLDAGDGGKRLAERRSEGLAETLPALTPLDHSLEGRSSWLRVIFDKPPVEAIPRLARRLGDIADSA